MARIPIYKSSKAGWETPREQFIYSRELINLKDLVKIWSFWDLTKMRNVAVKEKWKKRRDQFWENEKLRVVNFAHEHFAKDDANKIVEANRKHQKIGDMLQKIFWTNIEQQAITGKDGKTKQRIRFMDKGSEVIRAAKEGVLIERKALGIVDEYVRMEFVVSVANFFSATVMKYVEDHATLTNISRDVEEYIGETLAKMELSGK